MSEQRLELQIVSSSKQAIVELQKLNTSLVKLRTSLNQTLGSSGQMKTLAKTTQSTARSVGTSTRSMITSFAKLMAVIYTLRRMFRFLGRGIREAMDYREVVHMFSTVFSQIGKKAGEEFTQAMFDEFKPFYDSFQFLGFDDKTLMQYQAVFGHMANAMGVVSDQAVNISSSFTALGTDMTSLFNLNDTSEAMTKLQAGLAGQIRPLRQIGVDISKTTLTQTAFNRGITKSIEVMTASEKVQLRYIAIMEQLQVSMGDLPKTIVTPANQFRILREQLIQLARAIGSIFIPILSVMLQYLNGLLMAIIPLIQSFAKLFGYEMPERGEVDSGGLFNFGDLGLADEFEEAEKSSAKIKNNLMGFDEINLLDPSSSVGMGAFSSFDLGEEIARINREYLEFRDKLIEDMDYLPRIIQEKLTEVFKDIAPIFGPLKTSMKGLWTATKNFIEPVIDTLEFFYTDILVPLGGFVFETGLPFLIDGLANVINWLAEAIGEGLDVFKEFWNDFLKPIGKWVGSKISENLKDMKEKLEDLGFATEDTTGIMSGFQTIVGTALVALGIFGLVGLAVKTMLLILTPFIGLLSIAFALLTSPIAIAVLAVGAFITIGYLLYKNWKNVIDWLREHLGVWASSLAHILEGVGKIFIGLVAFIGGVLTGDWETAFWGLWEIVSGIFEMILKSIADAINWIIIKINDMIDKIKEANIFGIGKNLRNINLIDTTQIRFENKFDSPIERIMDDLKDVDFKSPDLLLDLSGNDRILPDYSVEDYLNLSGLNTLPHVIGDDFMNKLAGIIGTAVMAGSDFASSQAGGQQNQAPELVMDGRVFARLITPYLSTESSRLGIDLE